MPSTSTSTSWQTSRGSSSISGNWTQQSQSHSHNNEEFSRSKEDFFGKHDLSSPGLLGSETKILSSENLEEAHAALKEREAKLDEREAALRKREDDLVEREDALDAAHEKLIGGGEEEEEAEAEKQDQAKQEANSPSSNALTIIIEKLQQENSQLRADLAATKKRSGRFLSQRATEEETSGNDRFRLSERKPKSSPGVGLHTGFDPKLMERWAAGHKMMAPRKPREGKEGSEGS